MKKIVFVSKLICLCLFVNGQENILDTYIQEGLQNNHALKQKLGSYEKSLYALGEARGLFLPDVSFNARYSVARGGRVIDIPLGDLLNPVYTTLNSLTSSSQFPQISNASESLLRPEEHETKLRLVQPIFNTQIYYNYKIKAQQINAEKANAETYMRALVAEIKTSYFNYLKTVRVNNLLEETTHLLEENIRVNERLFENDMITVDNIYRSKAELSKLEQQKAVALKHHKMATSYFNFLLNRPLESEVLIDEDKEFMAADTIFQVSDIAIQAINNREELHMMESYMKMTDHSIKLNKSNMLPVVTGVVDYGFEGRRYGFTVHDDFVWASVLLQWNLFKGFHNNNKIKQAKVEYNILQSRYEELKTQISLEVINAFYDLQSAQKTIVAAREQFKSAKKAFEIVNKRYSEGQITLIQYIDARTTMTNAEENVIIAQYDYLIKYSTFEKVSCMYPLNNLTETRSSQ